MMIMMVKGPCGVQLSLKSYEWSTKSNEPEFGGRFVNYEHDYWPIGRHEFILPIDNNYYNFQKIYIHLYKGV